MSNLIRNENVRIFVQRPLDGRFMQSKKAWVEERKDARSFETAVDALVFCISEQMGNVKLVVTRRDQPDDVLYPFRDEETAPSGPGQVRKVMRSRYQKMRRERLH